MVRFLYATQIRLTGPRSEPLAANVTPRKRESVAEVVGIYSPPKNLLFCNSAEAVFSSLIAVSSGTLNI